MTVAAAATAAPARYIQAPEHLMSFRHLLPAAVVASATFAGAAAPRAQQDLTARARAIHERIITLDTHNDIDPQNFTAGCNYTMRLTTQGNLQIGRASCRE